MTPLTVLKTLSSEDHSLVSARSVLRTIELGQGSFLMQVRVDPEMALDWLTSRNPTNRAIRGGAIERYSSDMASGRWAEGMVNPIHFSVDGDVLNGQHRLRSLVETGQTVVLWIQTGCPREWVACMDNGLLRSQVDTERLAYNNDVNHGYVAVARSMSMGFSRKVNPTRAQLHEFMVRHDAAIQFAVGLFPAHIRKVTTAPFLAAIARAFYSKPHDELRAFAETIISRTVREPWQTTAIVLRNWMEDFGTGGGNIMHEHYAKAERAIVAWCQRQPLSKLYAVDREQFLLPGELIK